MWHGLWLLRFRVCLSIEGWLCVAPPPQRVDWSKFKHHVVEVVVGFCVGEEIFLICISLVVNNYVRQEAQ